MAELLETAQEVSKMTIAHEIVLNHDFKVQQVNFAPNRYVILGFPSSSGLKHGKFCGCDRKLLTACGIGIFWCLMASCIKKA